MVIPVDLCFGLVLGFRAMTGFLSLLTIGNLSGFYNQILSLTKKRNRATVVAARKD